MIPREQDPDVDPAEYGDETTDDETGNDCRDCGAPHPRTPAGELLPCSDCGHDPRYGGSQQFA